MKRLSNRKMGVPALVEIGADVVMLEGALPEPLGEIGSACMPLAPRRVLPLD